MDDSDGKTQINYNLSLIFNGTVVSLRGGGEE